MNAHVLCPGPSLASYDDDFEGLVVAINRSATAFASDVWCAGDGELVSRWSFQAIGTPRLYTMGHSVETARWRGRVSTWESLYAFMPRLDDEDWTVFSMTAGMVIAASMGATRIDVFGCDWTVAGDFDGNSDALDNRQQHRWVRERRIYERTCQRLAAKGVEVRRCFPPPNSPRS